MRERKRVRGSGREGKVVVVAAARVVRRRMGVVVVETGRKPIFARTSLCHEQGCRSVAR